MKVGPHIKFNGKLWVLPSATEPREGGWTRVNLADKQGRPLKTEVEIHWGKPGTLRVYESHRRQPTYEYEDLGFYSPPVSEKEALRTLSEWSEAKDIAKQVVAAVKAEGLSANDAIQVAADVAENVNYSQLWEALDRGGKVPDSISIFGISRELDYGIYGAAALGLFIATAFGDRATISRILRVVADDLQEQNRLEATRRYASKRVTASDRSLLIRLAASMPVGDKDRRAILAGLAATAAAPSVVRVSIQDELEVVDQMIDAWGEFVLGLFHKTEPDVEAGLQTQLNADEVNSAYEATVGKTAGVMDTVSALGGKVLSGAWHMLSDPFHKVWHLFTSNSYRQQILRSVKRAIRHEVRSTRHMFIVARRILHGESVPKQELRNAAIQFIDLLTKVLLVAFVGPEIGHLLAAGPLQALLSLMSPADELAAIMLDKPLRFVTQRLLGSAIGLLPSGFYTHF